MAKTANELIFDATVRHQIKLLRFADGEAAEAVEILKANEAELVAAIRSHPEDSKKLEKMLADVRQIRRGLSGQLDESIRGDLEKLAEMEADWEVNALDQAVPISYAFEGATVMAIKGVVASPINGTPLADWFGTMELNDIARCEQQVRLGFLAGETNDQIARRLLGTKAADYADGAFATTRREAMMIARTATNHISTGARQAVWEANSDVISGVRWVATLDGRTSPVCQGRDGEVYPINSGPRPPAHPNCRSTVAPVLVGEAIIGTRSTITDKRTRAQREVDFRAEAKAEVGADKWKTMSVKQRNDAIRARRSKWAFENVGEVTSKTTYQDWLKGQSKEFQDDILGPTKGEMFRNGMTLDKFVDSKGKPYSVAQLKAELSADKLNVVQPGVGLKAKAYLQMGYEPDQVLSKIKAEFPDANTSAASIASYKSELKKAGALGSLSDKVDLPAKTQVKNTLAVLEDLENSLPGNLKQALGGQWATVVDDLQGAPGTYGYYQAGKGVVLSGNKMSKLSVGQAKQVMSHELGHLLHKQHDLLLPGETQASIKALSAGLSPDAKKLYSYYLSNTDELVAEVYSQAISPSAITSQGLSALDFNKTFASVIEKAKQAIAAKFPAPSPAVSVAKGGPTLPFEVAGKHTSVGSLSKALLQQGMPDDDVLKAVLAEFPNAKTKIASIKSYKSELKKAGLLPNKAAGQVVTPTKVTPNPATPMPSSPAVEVAKPAVTKTAPYTVPVTPAKLKAEAIKLMESGLLKNSELAEVLVKQFPLNAEGIKTANIATWKTLWKKANPQAYAAAESLASKVATKAAVAGPKVMPKLAGQQLGPLASKALNNVKQVLAAGGSKDDAYAAMKNVFGSIQEPGASDLLDLAKYEVATGKAVGKPYLNSTFAKPKPTAEAAKAATAKAQAKVSSWQETQMNAAKMDFTPSRPASKPSEGLPPPPRFTKEQRAASISSFGGGMSPGAHGKVNALQKKLGLEEVTLEEVSAIKHYTGSAYRTLNDALRADAYSSNYRLQAFVETAQHGMMKMPKFQGLSSRGMSLNDSALQNMLATYRKGAIVEDHAFISTSAGSNAAFGGNVYMKIQGKTGVDISFFSNYPGEREVLFMPGTKFRIDNVTQTNGKYIIEATEI
ncbi:minor head protein [Pseudomonas phage ZQG1]|nr:minor head protein [Pseudomonas phage ZQG1]